MRTVRRIPVFILALAIIAVMPLGSLTETGRVYAADSETHYIAVGADRHDTPTAIASAMGNMPKEVEYVCLNGDMTDFDRSHSNGNPGDDALTDDEYDALYDGLLGGSGGSSKQKAYYTSTVLDEVKAVFPNLDSSNVSIIYASHDANSTDDAGIMKCADTSLLPSTDAGDHDDISKGRSGQIYAGKNGSYLVYGVSYYDMISADGGQMYAKEFEKWVDQQVPTVPIVVIGHVPIHKLRNDNKGATYWNKALNYAATGSETPAANAPVIRDVIYLHGHNHTSESKEYFIMPGGSLQAEGDDQEGTIYYTYITSGYMKTGRTATLIGITDEKITYTKYVGPAEGTPFTGPTDLGTVTRVRASEADEAKKAAIELARELVYAYRIEKDLFKDKTVKVFEKALAAAVALVENSDAAASDIEKARDDLRAAREGLILKDANTITVKAKTATVKYSKVKKKAQTIARKKVLAVSKAKGTPTYTKLSGNSRLTVDKKTGKIKVKKGTKRGTYKITVKVTAPGNGDYMKASKSVTITIKVK